MKILSIVILIIVCIQANAQQTTPEALAELQLSGYNARNIDQFLEAYSDSVKVYNFPDKLQYTGKENMRKRYQAMFENTTDLNCKIVKRIVIGNTVIDEEEVLFQKDKPRFHAVAIYRVKHNKIQEVYFITE